MDPELDINRDEIHAVLSLIKTLEPLGVGARNLSERLCLLLDAQACDPQVRKLAKLIVAENLSLLAARNYQGIRKALKKVANYSTAQVTEAAKLIGSLNPRISSQFGEHLQNQITADVMVQKKSGRWVAKLNPEHEIRLAINTQYTDMLSSASDEKSAEFLQNHLNQAKTFIKNVHSRYATLLAVAQAVVDSQQEFFEHGGERMTPLVLQDIASQLELHESTISRATAGKYLLCDRGLFELKYFFSSAVPQQDGNTTSSIAIRSLIKKLVSSESKVKPLSDSRLAKELESQGHSVARRTVAKYRESLQIAPSSQRKQLGNN
jgi:RNA polymerase sigma-54 factor